PAQPDPQVALQADVAPRDDERTLVQADPVSDRQAWCIRRVLHQSDRPGLRLGPRQPAAKRCHPLASDWQVLAEQLAGAHVTAFAIALLDGGTRHAIRQLVGADRDVVVLAPALLDERRRSNDPPDANARNPVRLRQSAGDNDAVAHAPEALRPPTIDLRTEIDLVGQQPGSSLIA